MVCIEEVYHWFKELNCSIRIDLICGLFNLCTPFELRFFLTVLEGKRDLTFWEDEANHENDLINDLKIGDLDIRRKLIVSLVLLGSSNRLCASKIFHVLMEKISQNEIHTEEKYLSETVLLLTLAARHPAFTFEQKNLISSWLLPLKKSSNPSPQELVFYNSDGLIWPSCPPPPPPVNTLEETPPTYPNISTELVTAVTQTYVTSWSHYHTQGTKLNNELLIDANGDARLDHKEKNSFQTSLSPKNQLPVSVLDSLDTVENSRRILLSGTHREKTILNKCAGKKRSPCRTDLTSPGISPLSSPVSSNQVSPSASGTSSRSGSPWQQQNLFPSSKNPPDNLSLIPQEYSPHRRILMEEQTLEQAMFKCKLGQHVDCLKNFSKTELTNMSVEKLENICGNKQDAVKLKKILSDLNKRTVPNGIKLDSKTQFANCHSSVSSQQRNQSPFLPTSPLYHVPPPFKSHRSQSDSSHSGSDICSPPASPAPCPCNDRTQLRCSTNSSSEENLNDQFSTLKESRLKPTTNYCNYPSPFCTSATYNTHTPFPLKRNNPQIQYSNLTNPPIFENRLQIGTPMLGPPRPSHLNGPIADRNGINYVMSPYTQTLTVGFSGSSVPSRPNPSLRPNSTSSCPITNHRYTPPKTLLTSMMDKSGGTVIMASSSQNNQISPHVQLTEMVPFMVFTQPPPPVPSTGNGLPSLVHIPLTSCQCTTSVCSASLGPLTSPPLSMKPPPPALTNHSSVTMPYGLGIMPQLFNPHHPHHPLYINSPSGPPTNASNFLSNPLGPHMGYRLSNGMLPVGGVPGSVQGGVPPSQATPPNQDLLYANHAFHLAAVAAANNGSSLQSPPVVFSSGNLQYQQQGGNLMTSTSLKVVSCYNCGQLGHKGQDCRESTVEDMAKTNKLCVGGL